MHLVIRQMLPNPTDYENLIVGSKILHINLLKIINLFIYLFSFSKLNATTDSGRYKCVVMNEVGDEIEVFYSFDVEKSSTSAGKKNI